MSVEDLLLQHPKYSRVPPSLPDNSHPCTSKLFAVSMHRINILKELTRKNTLKAPSTNTILCALIWTTVTRVRVLQNPSLRDASSRLVTAVNGRPSVGKLPSTAESPFLGNAVFYAMSRYPAEALLTASDEAPVQSFAEACEVISESQSPSTINLRHLAEVYDLADRTRGYQSLFPGWDLFQSRDLKITNWADLDRYGIDVGDILGKPCSVRLPVMEVEGVALILSRQRGVSQEVFEVVMMLRKDHMDALENDHMWQTLCQMGQKD
ncbi:hypothetical protein N7512_002400 [Penicillium capsulatum]|nr:hypothetical protein N7512_002400 [Penicillium capsulatum]